MYLFSDSAADGANCDHQLIFVSFSRKLNVDVNNHFPLFQGLTLVDRQLAHMYRPSLVHSYSLWAACGWWCDANRCQHLAVLSYCLFAFVCLPRSTLRLDYATCPVHPRAFPDALSPRWCSAQWAKEVKELEALMYLIDSQIYPCCKCY